MAGTISLNGYLYGGSGGITDVRVDGESKVSRGVADIDLSPYAKKTATQQALNAKQDKIVAGSNISIGADGKTISADLTSRIPTTEKGSAYGVAELDSSGKVPTSQLPSFVDDVVEYASRSAFPASGESGKIYVALDTNLTYRWSGTEYVEISPSLALGETSSTAYRGDRGKTAYEHATDSSRLQTAKTEGLYKVGVTNQGHISSAQAVQKADITALGIPAQDTTYSAGTNMELSGTTFNCTLPLSVSSGKFCITYDDGN